MKTVSLGNFDLKTKTDGKEQVEKSTFSEDFFTIMKNLDITELEPYLGEDDTKIHDYEKYEFLEILRDLFLEYRRMGDTALLLDEGICTNNCFNGERPIYKLTGNNSREEAYFGVDENRNGYKEFHGCLYYQGKDGEKGKHIPKMMWLVIDKLTEIRKRKEKMEEEKSKKNQ